MPDLDPVVGGPDPNTEHQGRRRNWQTAVRPHWIEIVLAVGLLAVGGGQIYIYNRQANIMDKQATIAADQNSISIADRRPWIKIDLSPNGPITFGPDRVVIFFKINLKNVGNSPATNIQMDNFNIDILKGDPSKLFNTIPEQTKLCQAAAAISTRDQFRGKTLFPNEEYEGGSSSTLMSINDTYFADAWPNPRNIVFQALGCVDYTFAIDPTIHGQTGISYMIERHLTDQNHSTAFDRQIGTFKTEEIEFKPDFFHSGYIK